LLLNMFAQGAALMAGKAHDDLARAYPGDRPSSTLLLDRSIHARWARCSPFTSSAPS
jgi:glucose-6-phosphate isomerase